MKLKTNAKFSDYLATHIFITTDYKWGRGWTIDEANRFENEVYPALEAKGYKIISDDFSMACPHIQKDGFLEELDLYFHPMQLTGYAKQEEIDEIVDVLKNCKSVYSVDEVRAEKVYDLTEYQYDKMLESNIPEILEWMEDYKKKNRSTYDMPMAFARECRLPAKCFSVGGARSSSDVDCVFIQHIDTALKAMEKQKQKKMSQTKKQKKSFEVDR